MDRHQGVRSHTQTCVASARKMKVCGKLHPWLPRLLQPQEFGSGPDLRLRLRLREIYSQSSVAALTHGVLNLCSQR